MNSAGFSKESESADFASSFKVFTSSGMVIYAQKNEVRTMPMMSPPAKMDQVSAAVYVTLDMKHTNFKPYKRLSSNLFLASSSSRQRKCRKTKFSEHPKKPSFFVSLTKRKKTGATGF